MKKLIVVAASLIVVAAAILIPHFVLQGNASPVGDTVTPTPTATVTPSPSPSPTPSPTPTPEPDTEPPVISGDVDKIVVVGGTVAYRKGITVTDNHDASVELSVDSSQVNLGEIGEYEVVYTATDLSGNTATANGMVHVIGVDPDEVYAMADEVLESILAEEMTTQEVVRAIYLWVRNHVGYVNIGSKDDVLTNAYNAFTAKKGDCYTFYAVSELLLTRADIENIAIKREGGTAQHFWNLVNIGEGWYHFDSCPYREAFDGCMFTETQAEQYTKQRRGNYYVYDKDLYPEVVQ